MTLENAIKDVIAKKLEDGTVEKLIEQQLEKGVNSVLNSLFESYGDLNKLIKDKIKSVMVPYLEAHDYSRYIVKLDDVMVDVLKNTSLDNKKILENFKNLMDTEEVPKEMKVTNLYEKWIDFVAENVNTDGLEVIHDDGVSYESVDVNFEISYNEDKSWSIYEYAVLTLECEKDEEMNFAIRLSRWKDSSNKGWDIEYDKKNDLNSLRYLESFEVFLMRLKQKGTKLILDKDYDNDEVTPEAEPEATFS